MDFKNITLFQVAKQRMNWLGQRQEVIAQNIANANTPGYRATDLKKFEFKSMVQKQGAQLNLTTTGSGHLGGNRKRIRDFAEAEIRNPYETTPNGNSVVLEEQMANLSETGINHKLAMQIYKKNLSMLKIVANAR